MSYTTDKAINFPIDGARVTVFRVYETNQPDVAALEKMVAGCSISDSASRFYCYSFKDTQALLAVCCSKFASTKQLVDFYPMMHALLAYIIHINRSAEAEVASLATLDFTELVMRPSALLDIAFESKVHALKEIGATEKQNRHVEWANIHKIVAKLVAVSQLQPIQELIVKVLQDYRQQMHPTSEEFAFALCRLADVLFAAGPDSTSPLVIKYDRFDLMQACTLNQPIDFTTYLFQRVMRIDFKLTSTVETAPYKGVDRLLDHERDFLVDIVSNEAFPKHELHELFSIWQGELATDKSKELVGLVKFARKLQNVPLPEFLKDSNSADPYLDCLELVLSGRQRQRFCHFTPQIQQANLLLLLASSCRKNPGKSIDLLVKALPYCVEHLGVICSQELTSSLEGSSEDVVRVLNQKIMNFIRNPKASMGSSTEGISSVHTLLRQVVSKKARNYVVALEQAIRLWIVVSVPEAKTVALVLRTCADFAQGLQGVEASLQKLSYQFLLSLVKDDEERKAHPGQIRKDDPLFIVKILFNMVKLDRPHQPMDAKTPSWTERLAGQELELFTDIANSTRAKKVTQDALFAHYMQNSALDLACRIAPSLLVEQLVQLVAKLQEPQAEAHIATFIEVVNRPTFSIESKNKLFWNLHKQNTAWSLLFAAKMFESIELSRLELLLNALDKHLPNTLCAKEEHKEMLHCLFNAAWLNDSIITLFTVEDDASIRLSDLICTLANKLWLDQEITRDSCLRKIQEVIDVSRSLERSSSPAKSSLIASVLKRSASPHLSKESKETLLRVAEADLVNKSKSPGSPNPLSKTE